jgi:hypothetical protein
MRLFKVLSLLAVFLLLGCSTVETLIKNEKENEVIFYTTYGYSDGDQWVIPIRIYVHHQRENVKRFSAWLASKRYGLNDKQKKIFRSRIDDIVADSEWREEVEFKFPGDPYRKIYKITDESGNRLRTDMNGLKKGFITISKERADTLLHAQKSSNGWLKVEAVSKYHSGSGDLRLIEPNGISVISDIDDTVKITDLPAGSRTVIENTFFKEFEAAPGMAELYSEWEDASFHYVTGAPWQLYYPLTSFLFSEEAGFPKGSLHMKNIRKNFFNLNSWRDLRELITNENVTFDQKFEQISNLFETFPDRRFILVGDSGEMDPEIYSAIRDLYPEQVKKIIIRDVLNARYQNPDRVAGMKIIPAKSE